MTDTTETVAARIERLVPGATPTEKRLESLTIAHPLVDDATFAALVTAMNVARKDTVTLPVQRFENLSRGRGWARKGRGDSAVWGERTEKGYRVGPGRWTVGGQDGFSRKGEVAWTVKHVTIGTETWTIAN